MAATFPTSPINGELANVNSITYVYASAQRSWTRVPGSAGGGGSSLVKGTTNVTTSTNGNANITINGTSNVAVFSSAGEYVTGLINATGNITAAGNIQGSYLLGNGTFITGLSASKIFNGTSEANIGTSGGNANITIGGTSNVVVVSTTGITVTGNTTSTGLVGTVYTNSIINTGGNGTGNIGSSALYFNTVFAKATSAQYADVAEWYASDADYEPGTVVIFGGDAEVTVADHFSDNRVAGVVSTNPAYIMNAGIQSAHAVPVALTGRVPAKVIGPIRKGNMMISAGNGRAMACATPAVGTVIGKAIENFDGDIGTIEIVVGRM